MKTSQAPLCGALALLAFTLTPAQAGTSTYTTDKNVVQPAPPPPPDPCAGPISYTNLELLYTYTDFDDEFGGDHANGGRINLEYGLGSNFYLTGGADYMHGDNTDLWIVNGGVGAHFALSSNIDVAVDGGILWIDLEFDDAIVGAGDDNQDDTGWYVRPHLRGKWGCFEAHAGALYRDMGDFNAGDDDGRWAGFGRLFYHLNNSWDITAGVLVDEDLTQWSGGVRWRF